MARLSTWVSLLVGVVSALLAGARATAQPLTVDGERVKATAIVQRTPVAAGDNIAIAIVLDFEDGWHAWPNQGELTGALAEVDAQWTTLLLSKDAKLPAGLNITLAAAQWPATEYVETGAFSATPIKVPTLPHRAVIYVPVIVGEDVPAGKHIVPLQVTAQVCNDSTCLAQQTLTLPVELTVASRGTASGEPDKSGLFNDFKPSVFAKILAGEIKEYWEFDIFGWKFKVPKNAYVLIFAIAFAAGLLMNFTPCVLPVVPLKVLSIQAHAKNPGKLAWFGSVYCIGIVFLYLILGLMAFGLITGGKKFDWGQIFTIPAFVIAMSLIIGVLAVGMMGLFTIRLPNAVYMVNPTGDSAVGNFLGGVLTGILAVPCTGPLLGATLAWILTQPEWVGLLTFVTMGVGMASPYALLIAFPRLVNRVPRGGPGGELLKQVLGLFMLAVAAYMAGNLTSEVWPWFIVFGMCVVACAWWLVGTIRVLRSPVWKSLNGLASAGLAVLFVMIAVSLTRPPPVDWIVFKNRPDAELRARIASEVAAGRTVIIDFTAKWCVNCHAIERGVLYSEYGLSVFKQPGVIAIKVDLSNSGDDEGWGTVREVSGGGGIPLIAVFGPAVQKPVYFQSFFKPSDLGAAVDTARGGPAPRPAQ